MAIEEESSCYIELRAYLLDIKAEDSLQPKLALPAASWMKNDTLVDLTTSVCSILCST